MHHGSSILVPSRLISLEKTLLLQGGINPIPCYCLWATSERGSRRDKVSYYRKESSGLGCGHVEDSIAEDERMGIQV